MQTGPSGGVVDGTARGRQPAGVPDSLLVHGILSFPCRVSDEATELKAANSGAAIDSRSDLLGDSEGGGLRPAQPVLAKGAVEGGSLRHYVEQILIGDGQSSRAVGENRWLG